MSLALLLVCRRSIGLANFLQVRPSLLRPLHVSPILFTAESSTLKSRYTSIKPSSSSSPFGEPTDEKSRRLKLQQQIRFREKFQLDNHFELIYAMPKQRMYALMHFVCTCASVIMFVFVAVYVYRDQLEMASLSPDVNQPIPPWILYSVATVIGSLFAGILVLIARMPVRVYYSPVRHSYALFYHPTIGVFRQKKVAFGMDQYQIIPQKLDSIESEARTIKIRTGLGQGLLKMKSNFYLIENYFRSKRDILRLKTKEIEHQEATANNERTPTKDEGDIWQTVVERKDQGHSNQRPTQRRTLM